MLTPRNANQFTIACRMTATREQGQPRDEAVAFGSEGQLVGIVSHPAHPVPGRPAVLLLNAGVLHRVGPHRLHVVLARHLAARGNPGLRLDLGGIGDSVVSSDAATFRESAVADTRAAMSGMTAATGVERFVLFGVCAGADNSIATALVDDRVAGIVLVDPHTYATRRSQLRDLRDRVAKRGGPVDAARWIVRVAVRRARAALARRGVEPPPAEGREAPPIATFRAQLTQILDRGTRVLAIYSGIHGAGHNDADQLFEVFPELRGRMDHVYFPDANHTFTELAAQAQLIDTVTGWLDRQFA